MLIRGYGFVWAAGAENAVRVQPAQPGVATSRMKMRGRGCSRKTVAGDGEIEEWERSQDGLL